MFDRARLTLTSWYLVIIMMISGMFSVAIYRGINAELMRINSRQAIRMQREYGGFEFDIMPDEILNESRLRVVRLLVFINGTILIVAGLGGYYLAGKTLAPIEEMIVSQQEFISNASHDLKTPLTAIRTNLEVALRSKELSVEDAKAQLKDNLLDVIRLQSLTENMLLLSTNQALPVLEKITIGEVVAQAINEVRPLANVREIKINDKSTNKRLSVNAIPLTLTRVLVALLDNAIKYSHEKSEVTVATIKYGNQVKITVTDTGIGISKTDLEKVKDRFYRADNSRHSNGHGLGLAIAEKLVTENNGTLKIQSKLKSGTTVTISLPLSA